MTAHYKKDLLDVFVDDTRGQMGKTAAGMAAEKIGSLLKEKDSINIIFAAAPSQNEFLASLITDHDIVWKRINAFHMDEYLGLPRDAPESFGAFLRRSIFNKVSFRSTHYLDGSAGDAAGECRRYAGLVRRNPPDIVFMGIGENTHLAFNDPPVADFNDPFLVKEVTLDQACRQQQVNDGCFATIDLVPRSALTLTIPALMQAPSIFCVVPGRTKAVAVSQTLSAPVTEKYPSTILRTHPNGKLFVDAESARLSENLSS